METIKIIDKRNGAIKEVKKSLAGDYIGTGNFSIFKEVKKVNEVKPKHILKNE